MPFRNIIEMSTGMHNNDERIFYTPRKLENLDDVEIPFVSSYLDSPRLVLSREVTSDPVIPHDFDWDCKLP